MFVWRTGRDLANFNQREGLGVMNVVGRLICFQESGLAL